MPNPYFANSLRIPGKWRKTGWVRGLILFGLLVWGCAPLQTPQPGVPASSTPTAAVTTDPTPLDTPAIPTETPPILEIPPSPSPTATPTPLPELDFISVKSIGSGPLSPEQDLIIVTVFWSDEGNQIYYALADRFETDQLHWVAYDLATQTDSLLDSPPHTSYPIWFPSSGGRPELQGHISPSGRYRIEEVVLGYAEELQIKRFQIWLRDTWDQSVFQLVEQASGIISKAEWTPDESKVAISFGYEGPNSLVVTDVQEKKTFSSTEISDLDGIFIARWTLQPAGELLAHLDIDPDQSLSYLIRLVSLVGGPSTILKEDAYLIQWSHDSKLLYYWVDPEYYYSVTPEPRNSGILKVYSLDRGVSTTLVEESTLAENGLCVESGCFFAVSPSGGQVLFWDGKDIWLVNLDGAAP